MKTILFIWFIFFSTFTLAADKKISCEVTKAGESAPWRYDEFIFNTDDFKKDNPMATHTVTLSYEENSQPSKPANYTVTPTHIIFEEVFFSLSNLYHAISRKTLHRTVDVAGVSKCTISDFEEEENIF